MADSLKACIFRWHVTCHVIKRPSAPAQTIYNYSSHHPPHLCVLGIIDFKKGSMKEARNMDPYEILSK